MDRLFGAPTAITEEAPQSLEVAKLDKLEEQYSQTAEMLRQEQESNLLLQETVVELESSLVERGWQSIGSTEGGTEFTRSSLREFTGLSRLTTISNPLVKRGVGLRVAYVWGLGVAIEARANGENETQDVNEVVQTFLDDQSNKKTWTSATAHEERERALATDGNIFVALFTSPLDGRVQVRLLPWDEITDVIRNPEDRDEPWLYMREWVAEVIDPVSGQVTRANRVAFYPAIDIAQGIPAGPRRRIRSKPPRAEFNNKSGPVNWDTPILHVKVNGLSGWKFGLPDVYAVLPWSRAYKEFLTDWAVLVKALSRFAWRATTKTSKASQVAAKIQAAATANSVTGQPDAVGATAVADPSVTLEAIPKTGATIDSESGRPLAAMVAAGLGVPVTMLLGDPGTTGARATAETLDRPTELEMSGRRELWAQVEQRLLGYVIDQAVKAPRGPLKGTVKVDEWGREIVTLTGDEDGTQHTVDIRFPPLEDTPVDVMVKAIATADQTMKMPPKLVFQLLAQALGVENIDELLEELLDEDGNWIPLDAKDEQVKNEMRERGELDPLPVPVAPGAPGQDQPEAEREPAARQ